MEDYTRGDWEPGLRLLLDYAVRLSRDAQSVGQEHIQQLRAVGWRDDAILEAVEVIGFFNYYNRLVDGLGVAPEPEWKTADPETSE